MKKMLVETTGNFMLMDPSVGEEVSAVRPSVVTATHFFNSRVALGNLRILKDDVKKTDEDFHKDWVACDKDKDMAVSVFLSEKEDSKLSEEDRPRRGRPPKTASEE